MKNTLLYIVTVLIWGSTWLAIEFQLGEVDVSASVAYRFMISAVLMWAIAFSTMLLMNIINTRIFFGTKIALKTIIGAIFGIFGIVALFWDDLVTSGQDSNSLLGLSLVLTAALIASLGNMTSVRNSRVNMNIFAVNAWGMLYGAVILCILVLISGAEFGFSMQPSYIASLLYLAVFGTVIAFATYYALLNNMGPEKASYVIVLFPVVAVALSSIFEGFTWTANTFIGFALVLLGNAIILTPSNSLARLNRKFTN